MFTIINWLNAADKFELKGRGTVFAGPAPFAFDKTKPEDMERFYKMPWVISHPDARDQLWRVIGVESWAIDSIRQGAPIGILVKPWEESNGKLTGGPSGPSS